MHISDLSAVFRTFLDLHIEYVPQSAPQTRLTRHRTLDGGYEKTPKTSGISLLLKSGSY
jgi:hypothetical protein